MGALAPWLHISRKIVDGCHGSGSVSGNPKLVVWIGCLGFEPLVRVEGRWETPPEPHNHQTRPPSRGKLSRLKSSKGCSCQHPLAGVISLVLGTVLKARRWALCYAVDLNRNPGTSRCQMPLSLCGARPSGPHCHHGYKLYQDC